MAHALEGTYKALRYIFIYRLTTDIEHSTFSALNVELELWMQQSVGAVSQD